MLVVFDTFVCFDGMLLIFEDFFEILIRFWGFLTGVGDF